VQRDNLLVPNRHAYERLESHLPAVPLRRHTAADTNSNSNSNANANAVHRQMRTDSKTTSYSAPTPIVIQRGKSHLHLMA
jgi:hypothetical protein